MVDTQKRELQEMLDSGDTRWFARRRMRALSSAGILSYGAWNPDLHPRGPDGQFIEKWGFVRWLVDGLWQRGQVTNLLPGGDVLITPDDGSGGIKLNHNRLYAVPKPKGTIHKGPNPVSESVPGGWTKTGAQKGSNPGAFYTTTEAMPVNPLFTEEVVQGEIDKYTGFEEIGRQDKPPLSFIATFTNKSTGERDTIFRGASGDDPEFGMQWAQARMSDDLKMWVPVTAGDTYKVDEVKKALSERVEPETRFYVKKTSSLYHSANEVLANELYKMAGVPMPDLYFGDDGTVLSKIVVSDSPDDPTIRPPTMLNEGDLKNDSDVKRLLRKDFAVDAWLANWDTVGMTYDNVIVVDDVPYRIDTGGSILYRAKGVEKGGAFSYVVGEVDTFLDPGKNPSASNIFGGVTQSEIVDGVKRVAAIHPQQIKDMVEAVGLPPDVSDILAGRRLNLMKRYGVTDPYAIYKPPALSTVTKHEPGDEVFWNPYVNEWQPGILKKTANNLLVDQAVAISNLPVEGTDVTPETGDLVSVNEAGIQGLYRVDSVDPLTKTVTAHSALDDDNQTVFKLDEKDYRVVTDPEVPSDLKSLRTQYRVAEMNERLRSISLAGLVATSVGNKHKDSLPIFKEVKTKPVIGDDLWKVPVGDYVFRNYADPENSYAELQEVFEVTGSSEKSVSLTNILDKKERILSWNEWVDETHSEWAIPDEFTTSMTRGLVRRDKIYDEPEVESVEVAAVTPEVEPATNPESTAWNTTPAPVDLGITQTMSTVNGVHVDLPVGEAVSVNDLNAEIIDSIDVDALPESGSIDLKDTPLHEWVGKSVVLSMEGGGTNFSLLGLWFVTGARVNGRKSSYSGWQWDSVVTLRSPSGQDSILRINNNWPDSVLIQEALTLDASVPQLPFNFKKDGTIVSEGVVVGSHTKDYSWNPFVATIFPEYSVSGKRVTLRDGIQKNLKQIVATKTIPQLQPAAMKKSPTVAGSKDAIFAKVVTKTKSDFPDGSWVLAPGGTTHKVVSGVVGFNSWIKVEDSEGKVTLVNANVVVPHDGPDPDEGLTKDIAAISKVPLGPPPFYPLKYGDGNDPRVGQRVKGGKGEKKITGTVQWVTPPGGAQAAKKPYALVVTDDGQKIKKSLIVLELVEESDGGLPETAAAAAVVIESVDGKFTESQIQDSAIKYVTADGHTMNQAQNVKDVWLKGSPKRRLTKDGYAPQVGMRMKTNDGQSVVVIELGDPFKNPNQVRVRSLGGPMNAKGDMEGLKIVSTLWVDHAAELHDEGDGATIPFIKGLSTSGGLDLSIPEGTAIYRARGHKGVYIPGSGTRYTDEFFYINEAGGIQVIGEDGWKNKEHTKSYLSNLYAGGTITKEAVIDYDAQNKAAWSEPATNSEGAMQPSAFVEFDPAVVSHEEALSGHFISLTDVAVPGAEKSIPIPSGSLKNLPKPADAPTLSTEDLVPEVPGITGQVGAVDSKPDKLNVKSIVGAGLTQIADKDSEESGSGVEFGLGDADIIEDMLVSAQIARDQDTKQEYVEFGFRMLETPAEETAGKLLHATSEVTYGKWVARPDQLRASQIKKGDAIQVRVSSMGQLKPSNGDTPNVRVVADPVLLGKDSKGTDIYRIVIASADGVTGSVDIEERPLPSVRAYDWDATAIASQSTQLRVGLTEKAVAAGWSELGDLGFDRSQALSAEAISIDATGAKVFTWGVVTPGGGASSPKGSALGKRVGRKFDDGSHVIMNAVPSSVGGTSQAPKGSSGDVRRWNEVGLVTIRVPVSLAEDPNAFNAAISRGMEAVGIPPEKQGPATPEQIVVMALNKMHKTYAPVFKHRQQGVQKADINDPGVTEFLARMNEDLASTLGRPVTLADVEIAFTDDGRFRVMVSDEVAKAIVARQGQYYYQHSTNPGAERIISILSSPNNGLLGGSNRFGRGVFTRQSSVTTDMTQGSGNRVYLTGFAKSSSLDSGRFIFSPRAIAKIVDVYINGSSDDWGTRKPNNNLMKPNHGGEYMVKDTLNLSQMAYYIPPGSDRDKIIEALKKKGITHINGRPIEEFIAVSGTQIDMQSEDFQKLGTDFETVPITDLIPGLALPKASLTEAAAEAAGAEAAGAAV